VCSDDRHAHKLRMGKSVTAAKRVWSPHQDLRPFFGNFERSPPVDIITCSPDDLRYLAYPYTIPIAFVVVSCMYGTHVWHGGWRWKEKCAIGGGEEIYVPYVSGETNPLTNHASLMRHCGARPTLFSVFAAPPGTPEFGAMARACD
jgi:hypothetical protein